TSVARRFTKVVLALRSVGGSRARSVSKAVFCDAIAPAVALALATRELRSSRRAATSVTSLDELARKLVKAPWSRRSCWITWSVLESAGAKYLALRLACGRSEERRVGKECRAGWAGDHEKRKRERGRERYSREREITWAK